MASLLRQANRHGQFMCHVKPGWITPGDADAAIAENKVNQTDILLMRLQQGLLKLLLE